ncbi:MAG: transcription-repair coupling factor [Planctomycetota bacterium]
MAHRRDAVAHPIDSITRDPEIARLAHALNESSRVVATGAAGSSTALVAAAVARLTERPTILAVAHLDDADEAEAELDAAGIDAIILPAIEAITGSAGPSAELLAQRLAAIRRINGLNAKAGDAPVIICPIQSLMQRSPTLEAMDALVRTVRVGGEYPIDRITDWLAEADYRRTDVIEEPGEFALRGGILDIFSPGDAPPIRLDFFGDELDKLTEIDLDTQGSDRAIDAAELVAADPSRALSASKLVPVLDLFPPDSCALIAESLEIVEQARGYFERSTEPKLTEGPPAVLKKLENRFRGFAEINAFSAARGAADVAVEIPVATLPELPRELEQSLAELAEIARNHTTLVACQNEGEAKRLGELIAEHAPDDQDRIGTLHAYVHRGYIWESEDASCAHAVVPYHELLHRFDTKRRQSRIKGSRAMDTFLDVEPGDYVVHQEHGIARFAGLELLPMRKLPGKPQTTKKKASKPPQEEYLTLEFSGSSRLHVPATQIDLVQKYVGGFSGKPPLSALGGNKWKNQRSRVAESVRDLAAEMLRVRAAREHLPGIRYPADTAWQDEFEAEFPYTETEDQLAALAEIKKDMSSPRPMDRLICGDVGFGKTELAIRAAFKACEFGKQVAVLVPTTVLAEQHERTFRQRFAAYPFRVESLSRFKTTKEINATLASVRKGEVDVIIGTHRLLSKDVKFSDLGLVVIDEEQRFGVEHKERLLQLRTMVDVMTLSATPIPRTLHMSMLGLRDISSLTTAPMDRRAVVTEVIPYNQRRVEQAIERELAREGQIYFVHNRVHDIQTVADDIRRLAPDAEVVVGHGQMEAKELEQVMLKFMRRDADILVSTTIIESGIDNPMANTMFIKDADRFGLAELHQLRGRVGRYKHRAYCYLLLPPDRTIKEVAQKRLKALEQYSMLGAGFKIAMRDLEIRGAGNLLGAEQSGHIATVGYEMYCRLLEQAVKDLTPDDESHPLAHTSVELGIPALIPRAYMPSDARRLEAYRRIATAADQDQLTKARADLTSAYGEPPKAVETLFELAAIRIASAQLGVRAVTLRGTDVVFLAAETDRIAERLRGSGSGDDVRAIEADLAATKARSAGGERLAEVYLRLSDRHFEGDTLLPVLRRRLGLMDTQTAA